jgi:(p)ppGpp synthase/HD superfamily hydrolase
MTPTERKALAFATKAHANQTRKYNREPYINHCIAVAQSTRHTIHASEEVFCAALLHDVVEDTPVTDADLRKEFGLVIAMLVHDVTDISKPSDGNRKKRKEMDLKHLANACPGAQTIKLCDLEDNTKSIIEHDPGFAVIYMKEKRELLKVLTKGDPNKHAEVSKFVEDYFKNRIVGGY